MVMKVLWLFAGLIVGVGFSSTFADSREPASYHFKVLAVSEEDAAEKAAEMMKDGALKAVVATENLLAASMPICKEAGNDFSCETKLRFRE